MNLPVRQAGFELLIWWMMIAWMRREKRKPNCLFFHRRNLLPNQKMRTVADGRRRLGNKEAEKKRRMIVWKKSFERLLLMRLSFLFLEFLPSVFWSLATLSAGVCLKTSRFLTTAAMVRR